MHLSDFHRLGIKNFTPREIERTGARLADVHPATMIMLQRFRTDIGRRVALLPGGLTTGNHRSPLHPAGLAVDFSFFEADGPVDIRSVYRHLLNARAMGIGLYHNGAAYSVHADVGNTRRFWAGHKRHRADAWTMRALIIDPADFT